MDGWTLVSDINLSPFQPAQYYVGLNNWTTVTSVPNIITAPAYQPITAPWQAVVMPPLLQNFGFDMWTSQLTNVFVPRQSTFHPPFNPLPWLPEIKVECDTQLNPQCDKTNFLNQPTKEPPLQLSEIVQSIQQTGRNTKALQSSNTQCEKTGIETTKHYKNIEYSHKENQENDFKGLDNGQTWPLNNSSPALSQMKQIVKPEIVKFNEGLLPGSTSIVGCRTKQDDAIKNEIQHDIFEGKLNEIQYDRFEGKLNGIKHNRFEGKLNGIKHDRFEGKLNGIKHDRFEGKLNEIQHDRFEGKLNGIQHDRFEGKLNEIQHDRFEGKLNEIQHNRFEGKLKPDTTRKNHKLPVIPVPMAHQTKRSIAKQDSVKPVVGRRRSRHGAMENIVTPIRKTRQTLKRKQSEVISSRSKLICKRTLGASHKHLENQTSLNEVGKHENKIHQGNIMKCSDFANLENQKNREAIGDCENVNIQTISEVTKKNEIITSNTDISYDSRNVASDCKVKTIKTQTDNITVTVELVGSSGVKKTEKQEIFNTEPCNYTEEINMKDISEIKAEVSDIEDIKSEKQEIFNTEPCNYTEEINMKDISEIKAEISDIEDIKSEKQEKFDIKPCNSTEEIKIKDVSELNAEVLDVKDVTSEKQEKFDTKSCNLTKMTNMKDISEKKFQVLNVKDITSEKQDISYTKPCNSTEVKNMEHIGEMKVEVLDVEDITSGRQTFDTKLCNMKVVGEIKVVELDSCRGTYDKATNISARIPCTSETEMDHTKQHEVPFIKDLVKIIKVEPKDTYESSNSAEASEQNESIQECNTNDYMEPNLVIDEDTDSVTRSLSCDKSNVSEEKSVALKEEFEHHGARCRFVVSKKHKCITCQKHFCCFHFFTQHILIHTEGKNFPCDKCPRKFSLVRQLSLHRDRQHLRTQRRCKYCRKLFNTRNSFIYHLSSHIGERPYRCDGCGDLFSRNSDLVEHRLKSGERPFRCEDCGEKFAWKSMLRVHQRSHSGDKRFVCFVCSKAYQYSVLLLIHRISTNHGPSFGYDEMIDEEEEETLLIEKLEGREDCEVLDAEEFLRGLGKRPFPPNTIEATLAEDVLMI